MKSLQDVYDAPVGKAVYDHHYGPPAWLREEETVSFMLINREAAVCMVDAVHHSPMKEMVYKICQNDGYIVLAGFYDDNGVIVSIEI